MKKYVLIILSLFLVACSGDDDKKDSIDKPSLSDISGVWDIGEVYDSGEDQYYMVIKDHGELIYYDYYGDLYDQGNDCYWTYKASITDLGNGSFEIVDEDNEAYVVETSIVNDKITFIDEEYGLQSYPRSSLTESDFTPLCEETVLSPTTKKQLKLFHLKK